MSQFFVEQSAYFALSMHLINEFKYSCLIVLCYIFFFILDLSHFLNCFSNILNLYRGLSRNLYCTLFIGFFQVSDYRQLAQWRAVIGIFNSRISGIFISKRYNIIISLISMFETLFLFCHYLEGVYHTIITLLFIFALLLCQGDIEINPGAKKLLKSFLSVVIGILIVCLLTTSKNIHS